MEVEEEEGGDGKVEADGEDVDLGAGSGGSSEGSAGEDGVEGGVKNNDLLPTQDTAPGGVCGKEGRGSHEGCSHSEGDPKSNGPCSNSQEDEEMEEGLNRLRIDGSTGDPISDISDQEDEVLLLPRQ